MWRAAAAAVLVVAVLGFLYVGSTHRDRCLRAGNAGCTILPWSGTRAAKNAPDPFLMP